MYFPIRRSLSARSELVVQFWSCNMVVANLFPHKAERSFPAQLEPDNIFWIDNTQGIIQLTTRSVFL